jgi:hypothetical protein
MDPRIREALVSLQSAFSRGDGDAVARLARELDALARDAGPAIDPRLRHFLERRSYAKAIALLNEDIA